MSRFWTHIGGRMRQEIQKTARRSVAEANVKMEAIMAYKTLPSQLEERIALLEKKENQGSDFDGVAWLWLVGLGIVLPAVAIFWGFNA
ncbi:hypothetical protein CO650_26740 [Rhizobium phaseoli]|nr:hypothetical protein CO650_26740 [Rhizobium phaseoli]